MSILRYVSKQTNRQTYSSQYFTPGVVLAPAVLGGSEGGAKGHRKNLVGYTHKYADFDIKLAYNH